MSDFSQRIANLSPKKLALLQQRLMKKDNSAVKNQRIPRRETSEPCPLSFSQQRLWFLDQLDPNSPFNICTGVRLSGTLNVEALSQTLHALVVRHEALRTNFVCVDGSPVQVVTERQSVELPLIDLSQSSGGDREAEVQRILEKEAQHLFNLSSDLMLAATLLRLASEEHILLLVMHHVAADGWSIGILFRELVVLYKAFSTESPSSLPELPIRYTDFAHWQRQWLTGEVLQRQLGYWKQQLAGAPPLLELPTDRPRPSVQTFRGHSKYFQLNWDLTQKIKTLSQQSGKTLFMTLLAAFVTLLSRYSGQDDIVVGSPIANRNRSEIESVVGFFLNTLVLRTQLQGDPTFLELLERVRETTLAAYDHQDIPFEKLVEELQPQRSLSYSPLFQVMFVLQNTTAEKLELPGLSVTTFDLEDFTIADDLFLSIEETDAGLTGELVYNCDLFDVATITRMVEHFEILLEGIVANPQQRISQLPLLSAAEKQQLLFEWNNTAAEVPLKQCFPQLFEAQVSRTPNAIAVVFEDTYLTYFELNARANRMAWSLVELGVGPETIVALLCDRNIDFLTAMLAVFKAGGAYLPLNPDHPVDRMKSCLEQSQVLLVLATRQFEMMASSALNSLEGPPPQILLLEDMAAQQHSGENLPIRCLPENLAYIIYTSGSTGKPKGAMLEHRGMVNHLYAKINDLALNANDVVAQTASQSFDISIWQFLVSLVVGGRVEIVSNQVATDPAKLLQLVETQKITILEIVPSLLRMILGGLGTGDWRLAIGPDPTQYPVPSPQSPVPSPQLRWLLLTGETLPPQLCRQWLEEYPTIPMLNAYGPTECSDDVTHYPITQPPATEVINLPIGRPILNTQLYVLDKQLQPVPIGVAGELYVGGVGVGRGYLNNPQLTQKAFIPDPFTEVAGARLYKTGDKVRYKDDGNIEFLGRIDDQVKVRGFRIELGEIEAVLGQHPWVQEAVAIVREDSPGNQHLVAYVVPNQQPSVTVSELRNFLKEKLPDYMVPSAFVMLPSLPLTPNGKIDKRALPMPDIELSLADSFVPPRTPTEEILANLWGEVLNLKLVGIHNNFFELGGHSLLATQVMSRLRSLFGLDLPLRCLFESPTVAELSKTIEGIGDWGLGIGDWGLGQILPSTQYPVPSTQYLPLSFAQARLWFLNQLDSETATYNLPETLHLTGFLNIAALEMALLEIRQRHEALRTTFQMVNGSPVQRVGGVGSVGSVGREDITPQSPHPSHTPPSLFSLPIIDLQHLPLEEQSIEVKRLANQEASRPFNLSNGPLLRVTLLRLEAQSHVLLLVMHHIVSDGWSMGIFVHELSVLYEAFCAGEPSPLPELPIQYADFAHWQRSWLTGDVLEKQLSYWKQQLAGAPPLLELPSDRPRPSVQTFRGGSEHFQLTQDLTQKLKSLSQKSGVTLFMTLMAAFVTLLSRYSGQDDIVIGSPIANRNRSEIEPLIGFFVNTLVLRTQLQGNPTFVELLEQVRETALDAYAHQDFPFEKLVEELQPQRSLSHAPLFQVMFVLQNAMMEKLELSGLTITPLELEDVTANLDLTLSMEETEAGLIGSWEYNRDLFDAATIQQMVGHFQTLLEGIVVNQQQRLSELPLLSEEERHQLLFEWNNTQREYSEEQCIHQLFEAQVERTPDAIAVVFENQYLTYQELNARSNQLAHHLQALGVGPEVLVGICVERSLEMVVGLLGILKAGGAYVPLDPAYPEERLSFMLLDSQVQVVIRSQESGVRSQESGVRSQESVGILPCSPLPVFLDADWEIIAQQSQTNPVSGVRSSNLAYVIYTSGSTGKPKGVMIPHRGVCNELEWRQTSFGLTAVDKVLQTISLSFDPSVMQIFWTLSFGGQLILPRPGGHRDTNYLVKFIAEQQITVTATVPAILSVLIEEEGFDRCQSLRHVTCGGEALPVELYERFYRRLKKENVLYNSYGPTEASIETTSWICQGGTERKIAPIGRAIANAQIYILDQNLQLVPVGEPGELYIGGAGLARGYLNAPELTLLKFIPNPWSQEEGARLYKTGDSARYLRDGNIEFLGRIDEQVKIRGFRIELGEIEALLNQYHQVQEAVVILREETTGNKHLVAYVVPNQELSPSSDELRSFLNTMLPDYMVPSAFVLLKTLPLTPNGKVDRRKLPAPDLRLSVKASFVPPRNPLELQLAQIWEEVLNVHPVGVLDNFFDLGGHSLLAVSLMGRIEQQFGKSLSLATLFQGATIEHLASQLQASTASPSWSTLVPIQPSGTKQPFFCVHPGVGTVLAYIDLARHLGPEQPFYGLESLGLDQEHKSYTRIEDMAAHYIQAMQTVQPQGPYLLGGWSLGGLIAFEIAQQLQAQGQQVSFLGLLDTSAFIDLEELEEPDNAAFLVDLLSKEHSLELDQAQTQRLVEGFSLRLQAAKNYSPRPYPGKVTLFLASEEGVATDSQDLTGGWDQFATQGVDIHWVPGNHNTMVSNPHVELLAQQLQVCLKQSHADDFSIKIC